MEFLINARHGRDQAMEKTCTSMKRRFPKRSGYPFLGVDLTGAGGTTPLFYPVTVSSARLNVEGPALAIPGIRDMPAGDSLVCDGWMDGFQIDVLHT